MDKKQDMGADDDKPGGPFQGLPRPATVRRRAEAAGLPPATRGRDAPVDDDDVSAPWVPQMRRDPERTDQSGPARAHPSPSAGAPTPTPSPPTIGRPTSTGETSAGTPSGPTIAATPPSAGVSVPTPSPPTSVGVSPITSPSAGTPSGPTTETTAPIIRPSVPSPTFRPGLLTPKERFEGRLATGLGFNGLAAALGLSPKHGERSIRRWEQESPDPDPDDRTPPRYVRLLARHAAGVPEVDAYLREQQARGVPDRDQPPRPVELLLLLAARLPAVAAFLGQQGEGALADRFRHRDDKPR